MPDETTQPAPPAPPEVVIQFKDVRKAFGPNVIDLGPLADWVAQAVATGY